MNHVFSGTITYDEVKKININIEFRLILTRSKQKVINPNSVKWSRLADMCDN
jgi:hypothetical protein